MPISSGVPEASSRIRLTQHFLDRFTERVTYKGWMPTAEIQAWLDAQVDGPTFRVTHLQHATAGKRKLPKKSTLVRCLWGDTPVYVVCNYEQTHAITVLLLHHVKEWDKQKVERLTNQGTKQKWVSVPEVDLYGYR